MSNTNSPYWKAFNVLARIVGVGFTLAGTIVLISGVVERDVLIAVAGFVVALLGVLVVAARPFHRAGMPQEQPVQMSENHVFAQPDTGDEPPDRVSAWT